MKAILSTVAALLLAGTANAAVVDVTITAPPGATWIDYTGTGPIGDDSFDMNGNIYTMNEQKKVVLGADVAVMGGGVIAAGTNVDSHYVWFDPEDRLAGKAEFTFTGKILGIIIGKVGLEATETVLGLADVTYLYPSLVGLELGDFVISADNVLTINWRTSSPGDHIRVITAAVPVPAAGGLLALGLLGLGALRRRKSI
jgi:opacity protein-like surface antigen